MLQAGQWEFEGSQQVPDAQGATPGTGFSTTGLTRAPDGTWWVANHGLSNLADQTYEPSLVHLSADFKTKLGEFSLIGSAVGKVKSIQGVAYDTTDNAVWVGSQSENLLYEISTTGQILKKMAVPYANGVAYDSRYNALWVCSSHNSVVVLVSADTGKTVNTLTLGRSDPDHLFVDTANDLLYYSYGDTGRAGYVAVVKISTGKELGVYKLTEADAIEGIYLSGDLLYTANNAYYHDAPSHTNAILTFDVGLFGQSVTLDIALSATSVKENSASGTIVGSLSTSTTGSSSSFTYQLSDSADGLFALSDGKIVTTSKILDYEAATKHSISIIATDASGHSVTETFSISVIDVADTPTSPSDKPITWTGTSAAETFTGGSGDDRLDGAAGDDIIYGLAGNDTITSGPGSDKIYGGDGDDRLFTKRGTGPDFFDGGAGIDLLNIDLGKVSKPLNLDLSHPETLQSLGDGSQIINVERIVITGGTGNDHFIGGSLEDTLNGYAGDDVLTGGGGNDIIDGGDGNDLATFSGSHGSYKVSVSSTGSVSVGDLRAGAPDGVDTVTGVETYRFSDGSFTLNQLLSSTPSLNAAPTAIQLSNALAQLPENSVVGDGIKLADISVVDDGLGTNSLGLSGADAASFAVRDTASGGHALYYIGSPPDYETKHSFTVSIDAQDPSLAGSAALHQLYELVITDVAEGGSGTGGGTGGGGEGTIPGVIYGTTASETLTGTAGDDIFDGGAGADALIGQAGTDTASYASASAAVKVDFTAPTKNLGDALGDSYSSIENITGSAFNDSLNGNSSANTINGGTGNDVISGQGGADILIGGEGNDTLSGNGGNDTLIGGAGNDTLSGGASGRDWFAYNDRSFGHDIITDFEDGLDLIDFRGATLKFADLLITQSGGDTVIETSDHASSITVAHTLITQIGASDFLF